MTRAVALDICYKRAYPRADQIKQGRCCGATGGLDAFAERAWVRAELEIVDAGS